MHTTNTIKRLFSPAISRTAHSALHTVAALTLTSIVLSACYTAPRDAVSGKSQTEPQPSIPDVLVAKTDNATHNMTQSAVREAAQADNQVLPIAQLADSLPRHRQPTTNLVQPRPDMRQFIEPSNEKYANLDDNKTLSTQDEPVSTFSIDVDTGAYANMRRFLQNGQLPPSDAIRIEEMLNYFSYDYPQQASPAQPFSVTTEVGPTPWNANTHLLHIGLQGYTPDDLAEQAANLVFLIDVSGSMSNPNKLGLLKSAMSMMVQQLDKNDTVSIVVYAGSSGVVLEPTPGNEKHVIERALARLRAGGSTNGAQGIALAYQIAMDNYIDNGTNRVILATDGDFNVGVSDTTALVEMIEDKRQSGIALTTLGFGMGNYNDHLMEQLADAGNGNYAYIDTLGEARKVLVDELAATLVTIAKDVKIQIEFNPATVSEYRLIGYTNRILNNEDFNDDKIDAGEIGAGHSVTALYEIALKGHNGERHTPRRYGSELDTNRGLDAKSATDNTDNKPDAPHANELAEVRLRFKLPDSSKSELISSIVDLESVMDELEPTSNSYRFAASVAGFGQLLRGDTRIEEFSFDTARNLAMESTHEDPFGYYAEYLRLLDLAQSLDTLKRAQNTPVPHNRG